MDGRVADDRVGAFPMQPRVLVDQIGLADHVIVEKQDDFVSGELRAAVSRFRRAAVRLLDHGEAEWRLNLREGSRGPVG